MRERGLKNSRVQQLEESESVNVKEWQDGSNEGMSREAGQAEQR